MPKIYDVFLLLCLCFLTIKTSAQCNPVLPLPNSHKPSTPNCWSKIEWVSKGNHANAYELCNRTGNWVMMFADEFDGNKIDIDRWRMPQEYGYKPGREDNSIMNSYNGSNENSNYVVSNGSLKILVKREQNQAIYNINQQVYWHDLHLVKW